MSVVGLEVVIFANFRFVFFRLIELDSGLKMHFVLTMGQQKESKLNRLLTVLPKGLLVDAGWMQHHGYSSGPAEQIVAHHWFDQVVRGIYRRPPDNYRSLINVETSIGSK